MNKSQIKAVKQYIKDTKDTLKYIEELDLTTLAEYDNDSDFGQLVNEVSNFIGLLDELDEKGGN
jgi:hypothetical protein